MTYRDKYDAVYNFHRERAKHLSNSDAFWDETSRMVTEMSMQYQDDFMNELLLAAYGELERMVVGK